MDKAFAEYIFELHRKGLTCKEIAATTKKGKSTIDRYILFLKVHGEQEFFDFFVRKRRPNLKDQDYFDIAEFMVQSNCPVDTAAMLFKASRKRLDKVRTRRRGTGAPITPETKIAIPPSTYLDLIKKPLKALIPGYVEAQEPDSNKYSFLLNINFKPSPPYRGRKISLRVANRQPVTKKYHIAQEYFEHKDKHLETVSQYIYDPYSDGFHKLPTELQIRSLKYVLEDKEQEVDCLKKSLRLRLPEDYTTLVHTDIVRIKFMLAKELRRDFPKAQLWNILSALELRVSEYYFYKGLEDTERRIAEENYNPEDDILFFIKSGWRSSPVRTREEALRIQEEIRQELEFKAKNRKNARNW